MPYSALSHLDCPRCGARHDADQVHGTCSCGSPLLARYDLRQVGISPRDIAGRPPDLWRYHELLPVRAAGHVVSLGEGMTPLIALPRLGRALGVPNLLMKDEGLIPTGTFKARGAAVGVSRAAELGVAAVAMPTNGNAGAAWSAVRGPGGDAEPGRDARGRPGDHPGRVRGRRSRAVPGRRADRGRREAGRGRRRPARGLSGHLDAARAVPDRGQEDHGPGDRRAARLAAPRRDRVPHRRRRGHHRHLQGPARAARARLGIRRPAAAGRGAGGGLRADSPGLPGRRRDERAVEGAADGGVRDHGAERTGRFPHPRGSLRHRRDGRGRDGRSAARRPAHGGPAGGQLHLPGGCRLRHRRPAAARFRLAVGVGRGCRAQHRHRADLPGHRAGQRARAPAVRLDPPVP